MKRNIIILIFLISGMAALTYEVVWVRMLSLIFGTTTFAVSTVLFSFMAGLALGSYFIGKIIDQVKSPLHLYAMLEIGIGLYAIFVPHIIELINTAYVSSFDENIPNFMIYSLTRFVFSMAVLIIPTTLMGGTLPVLSRYFVRGLKTVGWDVGILYTINTLGAVFGVLIAGFYLEATYGVTMTIYIASAANVMIGLIALLLATREKRIRDGSNQNTKLPEEHHAQTNEHSINPKALLWIFAISGFCALGYEVIWFRALLLVLYNNTYVFSIMLATFLTGLTLGSYLITRILDEKRNWAAWLTYIQIAIGIVAALMIPFFIDYHNTSFLEMRGSMGTSFRKVTLLGFFLSSFVMFIPTLLMGMALPIVNKLYINNIGKVGQKIGTLYAVNTLGAVLGSFAAGFLLIPYIGFIRSGILLAMLNVAAGMWVAGSMIVVTEQWKKKIYALGVTLLLLGTSGLFGIGISPDFHILMAQDTRSLFYKEGPSSTVSIVERNNMRAAFVNGNIVVGSAPGALQTVRMLAHLPFLVQEQAQPQSVAVIGFGMGVTTYSLSLHPVPAITVIEIAPEVLEGAKFFHEINHGVINDPRINLVIEDGRNYLLRTHKLYSIITADPTHPILGSGNLYTQEYYQQCYRVLSDDGVMVQYVPLHLLGDKEFRSLIYTFATVFKHSSLWYSHSDLVIMGTKKPLAIDYPRLASALSQPQIKQDMAASHLDEPMALLGRLLMGEEAIHRFTGAAVLNKDDHPIIEFAGPKSIGADTRPANLENLIPYLAKTASYVDFSGLPPTQQEQLRQALDLSDQARASILRGLVADYRNDLAQAMVQYAAAEEFQPSNPDIKTLLESARIRSLRGGR